MAVKEKTIDYKNLVKESNLSHIAIIMDGNRRWAKSRNLPGMIGHKEGVKALKNTVRAASELGIKYLTVYAFSTENWGRKKEEVEFLMQLLKESVKNELKELHQNNVKIKIIGDRSPLSRDLNDVLFETEELTAQNTGLCLQIAINYGARDEIVKAVQKIAQNVKENNVQPEEINIEMISKNLYTSNIPDPDLLVRTGGEQRISNYLLWQIAYTELYITEAFWPEYGQKELEKTVMAFVERERRFGKD